MSEHLSHSRVSSLCETPAFGRMPSMDRISSLCSPSFGRMPSLDRVSSLCAASSSTDAFALDRIVSRVDRSSSLCFPGLAERASSASWASIDRSCSISESSSEHVVGPVPPNVRESDMVHTRGPDLSTSRIPDPPISFRDVDSRKPDLAKQVSGSAAQFDPSLHQVTTTLSSLPSALTALVLDCGVGQTKALVLTYSEGVSVREARTAPAVVDFLGNHDDLRGSPLLEAVEGDAVHPFFFLDHKPHSLTPISLQPEHFLQFVSEVQEECKAEICFVGTSQWYKEVNRLAGKMVEQLSHMGVLTQPLTRSQEASFECAAIQYACAELGVRDLAGSIGSGGGSVQCFRGRENFNLEVGWRSGVDRLIQSGGGRAAIHEFDLWWEDTVSPAFRAAGLKPELKLVGSVLCTSACYYAAKLIGKASPSSEMRSFRALDVRLEMHRKRLEVMNLIRTNNPIKDHAMDLCNLSLHIRVLEEMVHDEAQLLYKRDWVLPGQREFRTTWSAGWYLFFLKSRGISFPSCDAVLNLMAPLVSAPRQLAQVAAEMVRTAEAAKVVGTLEAGPASPPRQIKGVESSLEAALQAIEEEVASRVREAQMRNPRAASALGGVDVVEWVAVLPKLSQFASLFAFTQWEQLFSFGLADFVALGMPVVAAVPLAKAVLQRRQSLLQDGSHLVGADWPLEDDVIVLNVGGALFSCYRVTLLQSSRLHRMFEEFPSKRYFFVDRDGCAFGWVLTYLRTQSLAHVQDWNIFLQEVEFFGLKLPSDYCVALCFKVSRLTSVRDPRALLRALAMTLGLGGYASWSGLFALHGKVLVPLDHSNVIGALRSIRQLLGAWNAECMNLELTQLHAKEFLLPATHRNTKNSHSPVRELKLAPKASESLDALSPAQVACWIRLTSLHAYEPTFLNAQVSGKDLNAIAAGKYAKPILRSEEDIGAFGSLVHLLQREVENGFLV